VANAAAWRHANKGKIVDAAAGLCGADSASPMAADCGKASGAQGEAQRQPIAGVSQQMRSRS
jgi:hypothetical protein